MIILYIFYVGIKIIIITNGLSNTQLSIRIYGSRNNNSFKVNTKGYEYTADSSTTYRRVHTRSSYQEAFTLDTKTTILQNLTKRLIMVASNMLFTSG